MAQKPLTALIASVLVTASPAFAQHAFTRTKTVDPTDGKADFDTIQGAIDAIGATSEQWTVLIYAGEYDEGVTLDGQDENIDLVGIDRDAVIISVSGTDEDGIVITSGTETSRNNAIRNLTIRTTDGHGIKIVKGGTPAPKDIVIENVTIDAGGTSKNGIEGKGVDTLRVTNSSIDADNDGISLLKEGTVSAKSVSIEGVNVHADHYALTGAFEDLHVVNSRFIGDLRGMDFVSSKRGQIVSSEMRGIDVGVHLLDGDSNVWRNCRIIADNSFTTQSGAIGVRADMSGADVALTMIACQITAVTTNTGRALGLWVDAPPVTAINCEIRAISTYDQDADENTVIGPAYAISDEGNAGPGMIIGGSALAIVDPTDNPPNDHWKKQDDVWDLLKENTTGLSIFVNATSFSKWKGELGTVSGAESLLQRVLDVDEPSATAVASITLTQSEQEVTTGLTDPDAPRALSIKGSVAGMTRDVYIIGTDHGGARIVEKLTLNGTTGVTGNKPFRTVTEVIVPAQQGPSTEVVSVGTTSKIGLHFPISAAADVLQLAKLNVDNVYEVQGSVGTVDATYGTIDVTITDGDSFEIAYLASR